ncbi:Type 1 glutamine amidotransferase-like domain-containing protein [Leucothrix arctica]|uniref:Peptidase n=1 Tax=Leucothrix arctica TaxID=1481894 RepID=A0A317C5D0_9GAMM|nr:Type 1 glutamine amidotransferase-like domain-containing protein [Leucothrix arctica]PWQ93479.1 hypothetical protein DKT75_17810 [Leucothrix arctica]
MGYIPNATDFTVADLEQVKSHRVSDVEDLEKLGLAVKVVDLKQYFDSDPKELEGLVSSLSGLWVSGGNVFILRQAMMLSGLDQLIIEKSKDPVFVYGGYSAGCCVLSKSLKSYQYASDANDTPYSGISTANWDGLGLINFAFMPHFQSDHSESEAIDKEIAYCNANGISYKPVKDGDVLIYE